MKRYIFAVLALSLLGSFPAKADTDKLTAADGWTKITTLPTATDIANNYYIIVDNSQDLMLGIAKGVNQNTKWYSLGVYYQTSVDPTSKNINPMVWTLETQGNGFAMRNLDQPASPFQTEWNAAWMFDTNDVYDTANDWCKVILAYADGSWTIQNGYYPNSGYLGPWNDGIFTNGAECAANKSGNNIGHFHIYAISRAQFKQNLLDNASETNPVDLTPWYVANATFDANNRSGWMEEGSGGNNNTTIGCEIWHRSGFKIYQNLTVPNGKYKVSVQATGSTSGTVYGTSGNITKTKSATVDNKDNFQSSVLEMIKDRNYGRITTDEITVSNGALTMGFKDETTDQWDVFDNFKLYCTGLDLSAYETQLAELVQECNDFINNNVVPTACETIIANAVSTYNKSYSTAKEYSTAIIALTAVLDTYRNNAELKAAYAAYNAFKAKVEALPTGETSNSNLATFTSSIDEATTSVEAATTAAAIETQTANIRAAALTYISNEDGQFDITFLASQNYGDWKRTDGSAAGIVRDEFLANRPSTIPSFAENFEWTAETTGNVLYQTVSDLPAGYYQVGMYTMALSTSGRDTQITTDATEGDANRSFAFAGNLSDPSSIQRTGMPIKFATAVDFADLTTLDVNVHLSNAGNLTFGVQKDANGSNWHFAQIVSIVYSNAPDLTNLKATRDALVAEAQGLLAGADADYLTSEQKAALQSAITAGNNANTFDDLNTVTLTTLPNAINTAKQQIQQAKAAIPVMIDALERFENDYNLADGTDYRRLTMSAEAWTDLLGAVNDVSTALDDISQASNYATIAQALVDQMDATDASLRLFKSYKEMVEGTTALGVVGNYGADSNMDTDATEETAITALNTAFGTYAAGQSGDFNVDAFLGENLNFSAAEGSQLGTVGYVYDMAGWEETYEDVTDWARLRNQNPDDNNKYAGQLYIRTNWTDKATILTAGKQKMLPVGKYQLSLSWNSDMENMTNLSCYKLGDESMSIGKETTEATPITYIFEVTDAATPFDLVIGFQKKNSGGTPAQIIVDDVVLTYLSQSLKLADADDNSTLISERNGLAFDVTLQGRTLFKDDSWNTLCLPFDTELTGDFDNATLMELDTETEVDGHVTGLEGSTLYMNFKTADAITAGTPYIIKWGSGIAIENPTFTGVTIVGAAASSVGNDDITFVGTYDPVPLAKDDQTNLFLGVGNTLYWPNVDNYKVNAFRAYFKLAEPTPVRQFVLNFGDGNQTAIDAQPILNSQFSTLNSGVVYDLQGRRLSNSHIKNGLYIQNGKKVIIK